MAAIGFEVLLGFLTFTGSLMAVGKLQESCRRGRSSTAARTSSTSALLGARDRASAVCLVSDPAQSWLFPIVIVLALVFGVLLVLPIGGADMPTVISLLNAYAGPCGRGDGLRAGQQAAHHRRRARRLVGLHPVDHHVQGDEPLVHQRAVRRVRPGAGGRRSGGAADGEVGDTPRTRRRSSRTRSTVVIIPGYGMAVAQAQHRVRELYDSSPSAAST